MRTGAADVSWGRMTPQWSQVQDFSRKKVQSIAACRVMSNKLDVNLQLLR